MEEGISVAVNSFCSGTFRLTEETGGWPVGVEMVEVVEEGEE